MSDQADALRNRINRSAGAGSDGTYKDTKVIAVVSGKGGVGKSNITVNFAVALQKIGKKVLIIDLDIGMANIDILLGSSSSYSIVDMINREMPVWSVMEEGPEGLSYIAGGSGLADVFEMDGEKADFFYRQMQSLDASFDYIFLDMGAGVSGNSVHFLLASHEVFLVTTPEPTAVTDAYGMIKYIHMKDASLPVKLIVNRAHSRKDGEQTAGNLQTVTQRFLHKDLNCLMVLPDDKAVWKAVRAQEPFILHSPASRPASAVMSGADAYIKGSSTKKPDTGSVRSFLSRLKGFMKH